MARNGSGFFSLVTNSWNPAINGVSATAADWQALINDVANSITQSVSADGQTQITGVFNYGANRIANIGAGTNAGDALVFGQSGASLDSLTVSTLDVTTSVTALGVTQPPGTSNTTLATTAFVAAAAFSAALPSQSGNDGLSVTTDGTTAAWRLSSADALSLFFMGFN